MVVIQFKDEVSISELKEYHEIFTRMVKDGALVLPKNCRYDYIDNYNSSRGAAVIVKDIKEEIEC